MKKASIETDMAQRIMLSLIPEVMDPLQRANTMQDPLMWAADVKVYRNAVRGALDLIKYGSIACLGELQHYPSKTISRHEGPYESSEVAEKKEVLANAKEAYEKADWKKLLEICHTAFQDVAAWNGSFGGNAWGKIAETLLELDNKYKEVLTARKSSDWEGELKRMKEAVVLMNVFDGLAHNTASVIPKVLDAELGYRYTDEDPSYTEAHVKYKKRVERLMDSKELRNPIAVYKEVEPIIDNSPYKYTYMDYIHRLRQHPAYTVSHSDDEILKIRAKKNCQKKINDLRTDLPRLVFVTSAAVTQYTPSINEKKKVYRDFYTVTHTIKVSMGGIVSRIKGVGLDVPVLENLSQQVSRYFDRFAHMYYTEDTEQFEKFSVQETKDMSAQINLLGTAFLKELDEFFNF